jgi:hypothetical protein
MNVPGGFSAESKKAVPMSSITRGFVQVKLGLFLIFLVAAARAGDFDPPTPRLSVLKPAHKLEVPAGGQARLEMMGSNLELFRYGQILQNKQNLHAFRVQLSEPSQDGTLRALTIDAPPDAAPGLYELRLFTPRTNLVVPVDVRVVAP